MILRVSWMFLLLVSVRLIHASVVICPFIWGLVGLEGPLLGYLLALILQQASPVFFTWQWVPRATEKGQASVHFSSLCLFHI